MPVKIEFSPAFKVTSVVAINLEQNNIENVRLINISARDI